MDGLHLTKDMVVVGAVGINTNGNKRVLGVAEGATQNAATVQALLDNLIDRGLATDRGYLFIVDGAITAIFKKTLELVGAHSKSLDIDLGLYFNAAAYVCRDGISRRLH